MKSRNDGAHAGYGAVSITLHWLTAFVVIAMFGLALAPGLIKGSIALHGTLGVLLLALVPLRAAWRMLEGSSAERSGESRAIRLAARIVHAGLYLLMVAVAGLGLMYVDAKGVPFKFFGVALPQIVYFSRDFAETIYSVKTWLAYTMLGLIFAHAAAAIAYHHFIRKDRVLRSMLVIDGAATDEPARSPALAADAR